MDMSLIIAQAQAYALKEIEEFGSPKIEHLVLSNEKGQELAEKLWADKDIVMLWTILMDLKIGQCIKENKLSEHVQKSAQAAQVFLNQYDIDKDTLNKIMSCIESHHGVAQYSCKEAEICANADCYRFLHPRGLLAAFILRGKRDQDVENILTQIEYKLDEKYNALSLDIWKQELEWYYKEFKALIKQARR